MPEPKPQPKQQQTLRLVPNSERILVQLIPFEADMSSGILAPGQLKAGENLYMGVVIAVCEPWYDEKGNKHEAKYKPGQLVYYSEYSAAAIYQLHRVHFRQWSYGDIFKEPNKLFAVSEDDVMAYVEGIEGGIEVVKKDDTQKISTAPANSK